ncbi:L,D-transpeptidase [bacterium]|jgi:hypothetical protein|nr:L,D-transpeptidase [bacterium]
MRDFWAFLLFLVGFIVALLIYVSIPRDLIDRQAVLSIEVNIAKQQMTLRRGDKIIDLYPVSSSAYGIGSQMGSKKTPLGKHYIVEKIGSDAPYGTIFKARNNTGQIAKIPDSSPKKDYVTTRILWLKGLDEGLNKGGVVDSYSRFIYIHGTPEEGKIGSPASHGCIRMTNADVITLFDKVGIGTTVTIITGAEG